MACSLATGGNHLPPKPPKVSFELSDPVKEYAAQLHLKLAGLESMCRDAALSHSTTPIEWDSAEYVLSPPEPDSFEFIAVSAPATSKATIDIQYADIVLPSKSDPIELTTATPDRNLAPVTTSSVVVDNDVPAAPSNIGVPSTSAGNRLSTSQPIQNAFPSTPQFSAPEKQHKRKRVATPIDDNSFSNTNEKRDEYYDKKTALLVSENMRRSEWHSICLEIKKEELAIKKNQSQFWDMAVLALKKNKVHL